ncbi:pyridoxamine 5'-phosphate oxidase family protein [Ceratobasidium sp. AG-Ba]|nr:pyridoxamine 5'-phosphate oxidase family protein [Ceratobasidium sp. AG-Ba]QRW15217.1 pyridoxamine 5'-phosphate oxidase family protein [Ceratobasidium sp. AG-Ba]
MPPQDTDAKFEKTALNTVRRRPDRGVYDKETISAIIREARVMHVAFVDHSGLPQCVPMLAAWHEDGTGQCYVYFHGYPTTRILNTLSDAGTPIVASATLVDGLVLALSAFSHSMNYRSAVVHGVAFPISPEEKQDVFKLFVEQLVPGRWDASRQPDQEDSDGTGILRMKVETASAKIRTGPPKDEKKDVTNQELVSKTWTGVIPLRVVPGTPEPSSYCIIPPPAHVDALAGKQA